MLNNQLNCLYYPFSRLLDENTLKYYLLVFDTVTFIDEVQDTEWRRKLLQDLSGLDKAFCSYEKIADEYTELKEKEIVKIISPKNIDVNNTLGIAIATIADLEDTEFVAKASKPYLYQLPAISLTTKNAYSKKATWQVFRNKIASPLLEDTLFINDPNWGSHILYPGDDYSSWTLSYEAGSAAVINYYLEAAQELGLTPITNSQLHHELVLRKAKRAYISDKHNFELIDDCDRRRIASLSCNGELINFLGGLFPPAALENCTFSDILKFRLETEELRHKFLNDINQSLRIIDEIPSSIKFDTEIVKILQHIEQDFRNNEQEIKLIRNKLFPSIFQSILFGTAGGGALGSLVSIFSQQPGGILATSGLTVSGVFLAKAIDIWNQYRKVQYGQKSSIAYLSRVEKLLR